MAHMASLRGPDTAGRVRRARAADIPQLVELFAEFFTTFGRTGFDGDRTPPMTAEAFARDAFGADARLRVLVATAGSQVDGERLCGYSIWSQFYSTDFAASGGYLSDLYVRPTSRAGGIGAALLRATCSWVNEEGGRFLFWHSSGSNPFSRPFYERFAARLGDDVVYVAAGARFGRLVDPQD